MKDRIHYTSTLACDFCGTKIQDLDAAQHEGWDWFTGLLKETVHVCPSCLAGRRGTVLQAMEQAGVTP